MQKDLFDVTVILDRSGSMGSCRVEAEGGLNRFIEDQKRQPGRTIFTLVQFDDVYEFVHKGVPVEQVGHCPLVPRGYTALYDAVGRAIVETGERLKKLPEAERPGVVMFAILTDGMNNASKEFTCERVREMIEHQRSVYNWQFMFLGANHDPFATAGAMGIPAQATSGYSTTSSKAAFAGVGTNALRMKTASLTGGDVSAANSYTQTEREEMNKEKTPTP